MVRLLLPNVVRVCAAVRRGIDGCWSRMVMCPKCNKNHAVLMVIRSGVADYACPHEPDWFGNDEQWFRKW